MHEFVEWPKTKRLFRDIVITEKLDGTNSGIHISAVTDPDELWVFPENSYTVIVGGVRYVVTAQSRKRIITPGKTTDNFGFAGWVYDNAVDLVSILGEGLHFGEWYGQGIQRGYGLDEKRFALFNTARWREVDDSGTSPELRALDSGVGAQVDAVPVIYEGPFDQGYIRTALWNLREHGSWAAPGFMNPEGVCVYHSQSRNVFKVTLDNQDAGKWEVAA
ncbi:RNA ligase family protein [Streptomyces scopuliridis]|uniref:RNA ligase family protein n=1 Tax=Streptomyces scopuliridis TaxID=452529 RepID=A0ACD4ZSG4_9ACTN|nr:RNA ligase family protein [Streptomyces scopuliridis]WSC01233.1 RNA ligase family protein [Streptomyces scopuliridis]